MPGRGAREVQPRRSWSTTGCGLARPTEADRAARRLGAFGMAATIRTVRDLAPGPALAARARSARYGALEAACAERGIVHLLLGHHRLDQAETLMIRSLSGSGVFGFAGMAMLVETPMLRLLRPLLGVPPARLRATLAAAGIAWIEDPSNRDTTALRPRLRLAAGLEAADSEAAQTLAAAADVAGRDRAASEYRAAHELAAQAELRPEGFAVIRGTRLDPVALAALISTISGASYPLAATRVAAAGGGPTACDGRRGADRWDAARTGRFCWCVRNEPSSRPLPRCTACNGMGAFVSQHRGSWVATSRSARSATTPRRSANAATCPHAFCAPCPRCAGTAKCCLCPIESASAIGSASASSRADAAVVFAPRRPAAGAPFFTGGRPFADRV